MDISKILVLGMPRTATTQLQLQLSIDCKIKNLSEPFRVDEPGGTPYVDGDRNIDLYTWVAQQKNCSIKLLATDLFTIDMLKIVEVGNFDLIVLTKRKNLTDCCLSLFVAEKINKYHHTTQPTIDPFLCDIEFVKDWINTYNKFNSGIATLDKLGIKYHTVYYEDYINDKEITINNVALKMSASVNIPYLNTNIPYGDLCLNYNEVKTIIDNNG